jgi:hypothetical protein
MAVAGLLATLGLVSTSRIMGTLLKFNNRRAVDEKAAGLLLELEYSRRNIEHG